MQDNNSGAAIYCRLALKDACAMEAQRLSLRRFARELGYADCAEYVDNGASGLALERPAFIKINADIRAGRVRTVIVKDIAAISRNAVALLEWMRDVKARGVVVILKNGEAFAAPGIGKGGVVMDGGAVLV